MALEPPRSNMPLFRPDGYLPEGVTAKEEPSDIDTVILLPEDCTQQLAREYELAVE